MKDKGKEAGRGRKEYQDGCADPAPVKRGRRKEGYRGRHSGCKHRSENVSANGGSLHQSHLLEDPLSHRGRPALVPLCVPSLDRSSPRRLGEKRGLGTELVGGLEGQQLEVSIELCCCSRRSEQHGPWCLP